MGEYIVFRIPRSSGPSFNEAAAKLKARADLTIKDRREEKTLGLGMFLIEAEAPTVKELERSLPGWLIEPNRKLKLI